ncbi:uncharacterized protein LOC119470069 [Cebus imitator]|uniref:uncharacterized protein LOC119470069 n=1 Tax=Cebus imitator TaxID=2715852 RepID=UPI00189B0AAE|nr:uncharacterized protein LOC119470069 [Cebus imitator]
MVVLPEAGPHCRTPSWATFALPGAAVASYCGRKVEWPSCKSHVKGAVLPPDEKQTRETVLSSLPSHSQIPLFASPGWSSGKGIGDTRNAALDGEVASVCAKAASMGVEQVSPRVQERPPRRVCWRARARGRERIPAFWLGAGRRCGGAGGNVPVFSLINDAHAAARGSCALSPALGLAENSPGNEWYRGRPAHPAGAIPLDGPVLDAPQGTEAATPPGARLRPPPGCGGSGARGLRPEQLQSHVQHARCSQPGLGPDASGAAGRSRAPPPAAVPAAWEGTDRRRGRRRRRPNRRSGTEGSAEAGWLGVGLAAPRTGGSSQTAREREPRTQREREREVGRERRPERQTAARARLLPPRALLAPCAAARSAEWERTVGTGGRKRDAALLAGRRDSDGRTDQRTDWQPARGAASRAERRLAGIPRGAAGRTDRRSD